MNSIFDPRGRWLWLWLLLVVYQSVLRGALAADPPAVPMELGGPKSTHLTTRPVGVSAAMPPATASAYMTPVIINLKEGVAGSTASARPFAPDQIRQPVADLYAALLALTQASQTIPFQQRYERLAPVIERVFDLDYILKASVGRNWPAVSEVSPGNLVSAFRRFTVVSYVANFEKDSGQQFEILPERRQIGADEIVQTHIIAPTGGLMRLDYVMHYSDSGWRVVDVLLNGTISRVAVQHSDFRALLHQDEAESLIGSLQHKVADLSGGTLGP